MPLAQIIDSVIALATCAAAWCSYKAAKAAEIQGRAAWEQVGLQRPRPVVTVEGSWSLENSTGGSNGFVLKNIGSSPAFDIEVSEIEGPLLKKPQEYRERLTTDHISVLEEKKDQEAIHHRRLPGTVIGQSALPTFLLTAGQTFPIKDNDGNPTLEHKLEFFLKYSTLDGRRIKADCLICFNLGIDSQQAKIVPVSSWVMTPGKAGGFIFREPLKAAIRGR